MNNNQASKHGDDVLKRLAKVVYNRIKKGKGLRGDFKFGKGPEDKIYYKIDSNGFLIFESWKNEKNEYCSGFINKTWYTKSYDIKNMDVDYELHRAFTCSNCVIRNSNINGFDESNNYHIKEKG